MCRSLHRLPAVIALIALACGSWSWLSAKTDWEQKARERKADYLFLEAQSADVEGEFDRYIVTLERARALNPNDIDIAADWATLTVMDQNADSAEIAEAYTLLKQRFDANPNNYYSGVIAANVAKKLGHFDDAVHIWESLDSIFSKRPDVAHQLAESYLIAYVYGDSTGVDKAMAIYDRIQSGTGRSVSLSSDKINAYYLKKDTTAVIAELDSLYADAPNDSYTSLFIGAHMEHLGMTDRAITYYDRACELDSTNGTAYLTRAKFYNTVGDSIGFDREVFKALKSQNLDVESKIGILRSYVSELYTDPQQETRIRQLFDELQLMHSGEAEIHSLYGAYLYEIEDYPGAVEQFSYSTALTPNDESAWTTYVQVAGVANDTTTILSATEEAIKRFPDNLYFPILRSNTYRILGDNDKAMAVFDSVKIDEIRNERAVSAFLTSKGDLYTIMGDTLKALEIYDEAVTLNPDNSMALNNAAYFIALTDGDLSKAEKYSARSLQYDELNPTYLDTYAWVLFKKKDYAMAKTYIDIALNAYTGYVTDSIGAYDTDYIEPLDDGDIVETDLRQMGSNDLETEVAIEAIEAVDYMEEEDTPSADIYDHAGDIYFMNGEIDRAVEFWQKAYELDPTDPIVEKKVTNRTIFFR